MGCRGGDAIQLSKDHKPDVEEERERIEAAGGKVIAGRVNGRLSLTRGLGDFAYKKNKTSSPDGQIITAFADVFVEDLHDEDEFLVIGCDGLWERRTSQEVVEFVKPRLDQS